MTVSSQTPINRSTGNGVTTVFPYGFKIISEADIEVTVDGVVKTLNVDYTVSGVGNEAGGNVTMTAAPANLASVVRRRNMALVRTTDYQDQGEMPAATLDNDFDSAVLMIQQVDEQIGRAVTVPAGVSGFDGQLPDPVSSMFLRINSAADGFDLVSEVTPGALTVTPFIETLLNDTDATAARVTLGAQVAGSYQAAGSYAASGANNDITSLSALTNGIVGTSGNQTIAGTKTFSTQPVLPNAPALQTLTATASGTGVEFTSIPSWVKKITVMMHGTSTNGSSNLRFQIGPSGGVETSGYLSSSAIGTTYGLDAGGFSLTSNITSASISSGIATFVLMDSATNLWAYSATTGYSNAAGAGVAGGSKALAGTLSRLKLTTVNGADTFDAGSINILWE